MPKATRTANQPAIDPSKIYMQAESFEKARRVLHRLVMTDAKCGVAQPMMTNAAFACELYLKCLIAIEVGFPPMTHDLSHLFNALSLQSTTVAKRDFEDFVKADSAIRETMKDVGIAPTLEDALTHTARAFERIRYSFEGDLDLTYVLTPLHGTLRRLILEKHPEWASLSRTIEYKPVPDTSAAPPTP